MDCNNKYQIIKRDDQNPTNTQGLVDHNSHLDITDIVDNIYPEILQNIIIINKLISISPINP